MRAVVNGEAVEIDDGCALSVLVGTHLESPKGVAVAINGEVVPRSAWDSTVLADGDRIELLTAAQGG